MQGEMKIIHWMMKVMMLVGGVGALIITVARVWIFPGLIDSNTGVLDSRWLVMGFMLFCLVALIVLAFFVGGIRRDLSGGACGAFGIGLLLSGVLLGIGEGDTLLTAIDSGEVMQMVQGALGVFSAAAFVVLAVRLLGEGVTRRGISQWSMLLPVLWMWARVINYETSYSSLARLEDSFFGFSMLILELLFLFKLARYASGVGGVRTGSLLFYCASTALFALSAGAVKIILYLLDDGLSVAAYDLAGVPDLAVGALALVMGITQLWGKEPAQPEDTPNLEESSAKELLFPSEDDENVELVEAPPSEE